MDWRNKLYFGDSVAILREHLPEESVELIYLDPPFNSNATYTLFVAAIYDRLPCLRENRRAQFAATAPGKESAAQIMAFEDVAAVPLYERRYSLNKQSSVLDRRYTGSRRPFVRKSSPSGLHSPRA